MAGNDANTKILLHGDGTNGSTTFPDVNIGGSAHTWTAGGNAKVSTAQSKFGGAAMLFGGVGDFVSSTSSTDWNFSGDFTVDYWVYFTSLGSSANSYTSGMWCNNDGLSSSTIVTSLRGNATPNFAWMVFFDTTFTSPLVASSAPVINTWYHVAVVRSSGTITLYINGTSAGSITNSTTFANGLFKIGQYSTGGTGANRDLAGYIDEFRVSNTARWTTNFTPSSSAYGAVYSVTAAAGSYALTGNATGLGRLFRLVASTGSYALSGVAVANKKAISIVAAAGAYAITGKAAIIGKQLKFAVSAGAYALTGVATTLLRSYLMTASAGNYALTGKSLIQAVAAGSANLIRRTKFVLQKLRTSAPTLDQ